MSPLVPHVLPLVLYLAIPLVAGAWLGPWTDATRAIVAALALALFAARGAYPELRVRPRAAHVAVGIALGLAVGAAWVPLALAVPPLVAFGRTSLPWDAALPLVAARLLGLCLVVPFAEELLTRSALPRFLDAGPGEDWRARPVGSFTRLSATISVAFFALGHPEWLAALVTGLLWTGLLARTRNLWVVVVAHVAANAALAGYVLVTDDTRWW